MRQDWGPLALITQLGITMVGAIVLGLVLGLWLDAHFGTKPWGTLILSLVGIGAGTLGVYRLIAMSIEQATEARRPRGDDKDREQDS
jgi:F0F1-type ATP synthase assembly protein I